MKLKPIIELADYQILRNLIKRNQDQKVLKEAKQLSDELDRAIVIKNEELNPKIIRIGSEIEIEEAKSKRKMKIQLVLPEEANLPAGKVSLLAPLGVALIGFSENDEVNWEMPGGSTMIKILNVSNEHLVE
ncbi:GreA/GreB family elongation factor [Moheibacter lacus]|uniref:GreA/GreB family elongation factor n=1 Tax=Moheibacter lacus TaxID=2745851 RepID=A0A838ZFP7_9FLAO|nr:GreA/GreB family elongation factor [Moheibacter lacus]MBA5628551.1 GreA/GreB family elongation factor [Moheibacter lacus]